MTAMDVYDRLTDREREILTFAGLPYSVIAETFAISSRTVEAHMANIAEKVPEALKGEECPPSLAAGILRAMLGIELPDVDTLDARIPETVRRRRPGEKSASKRSGYVYFVRTTEIVKRIKIGLSYNPVDRFEGIRTASPLTLELLGYVDGGLVLEEALHRQFGHQRLHGEWFELTPDLAAAIDTILRGPPE